MSIDYSDTGLGRTTDYDSALDARLLYSIARVRARQAQGAVLGFVGCDLWTAYELSWLNGQGLPQSAIAEFSVPCDSPNIVESKSVKLYLNSYHQHVEPSWSTLQSRLRDDLSSATGGGERPSTLHCHPSSSGLSGEQPRMQRAMCETGSFWKHLYAGSVQQLLAEQSPPAPAQPTPFGGARAVQLASAPQVDSHSPVRRHSA